LNINIVLIYDQWDLMVFAQMNPMLFVRYVNRYLENLFGFNGNGSKSIYWMNLWWALLTNIDIQWNKWFILYKIFYNKIQDDRPKLFVQWNLAYFQQLFVLIDSVQLYYIELIHFSNNPRVTWPDDVTYRIHM